MTEWEEDEEYGVDETPSKVTSTSTSTSTSTGQTNDCKLNCTGTRTADSDDNDDNDDRNGPDETNIGGQNEGVGNNDIDAADVEADVNVNVNDAAAFADEGENNHQTKEETMMLQSFPLSFSSIFYCPITKKLMKDPVVVPDGTTYERSSILQIGQDFLISEDQVYPNRALQMILQDTVQTYNKNNYTNGNSNSNRNNRNNSDNNFLSLGIECIHQSMRDGWNTVLEGVDREATTINTSTNSTPKNSTNFNESTTTTTTTHAAATSAAVITNTTTKAATTGTCRNDQGQDWEETETGREICSSPPPPLSTGFYCPISLGIMHVPVIDCEGNTYEKVFIESWIRKNGASPITRTPLTISSLYPNHAISELLEYESRKSSDTIHPSIQKWKMETPPVDDPDINDIDFSSNILSNNNSNSNRNINHVPSLLEEREEKLGGIFCLFQCDWKKAVAWLSVISFIFSVSNLIIGPYGFVKYSDTFDRGLVRVFENFSSSPALFYSWAAIDAIFALMAFKFQKNFDAQKLIVVLVCIPLCFFLIYYWTMAVSNEVIFLILENDYSWLETNERREYYHEIIKKRDFILVAHGVLDALRIYAMAMYIKEIRLGIMSPETYSRREEYSLFCRRYFR